MKKGNAGRWLRIVGLVVSALVVSMVFAVSPANADAGEPEQGTVEFEDTQVDDLAPSDVELAKVVKLSHKKAAALLKAAGGITLSSSGKCTDRNKRTCTSLTQVNKVTIDGIIAFRKASKCRITITGGTETGHATMKYSHWNGYKLDIADTGCVTKFVRSKFPRSGSCGGYARWKSPAGNLYCHEANKNHFDITYFKPKP